MSEAAEPARGLLREIRKILLEDWDPIGIQAIPEAQDEYDNYIPQLYYIVISRRPIHEVFKHLLWIEKENMGLTVNQQHTMYVAEKIVGLNG